MERIKNKLSNNWFAEYLFSRFKLYRKWIGGNWYYVISRLYPYMKFWTKHVIYQIEYIHKKEVW